MRLTLSLMALLACTTFAQTKAKPSGPVKPPVPAPVKPTTLEAVRSLLSGYEYVPSKADFDQVGPEALAALQLVVNDPQALSTTRSRAVAAMAMVGDPLAEAVLEGLVFDASRPVGLRSHAARALGARAGSRAMPVLGRVLEDANPELREAGVRGLVASKLPAAKGLLEKHLSKEATPEVQAVTREGLERFGRSE